MLSSPFLFREFSKKYSVIAIIEPLTIAFFVTAPYYYLIIFNIHVAENLADCGFQGFGYRLKEWIIFFLRLLSGFITF